MYSSARVRRAETIRSRPRCTGCVLCALKREHGRFVECLHLGETRSKVDEIEQPCDGNTGTQECHPPPFVAHDTLGVEQRSNTTRIDERHRAQVEDDGFAALRELRADFDELRGAREVEFAIDHNDRCAVNVSAFDAKADRGALIAHSRPDRIRSVRSHVGWVV